MVRSFFYTDIWMVMQVKSKRRIKRSLVGLVTFYLTSGVLLYLIQDLLFFHPKPLPAQYQFQIQQPFTEINIRVEDRNLNLVQFKTGKNPKGVILYFHGNMRNIERYAPFVPALTQHGYEVWMMDYPGFGKSTGKRSEQTMYDDAERVYEMAVKTYTPDQLVIYGRSIGTGVASYLASKKNCQQLILETPYYNITSLARHYAPIFPVSTLLQYSFPTNEFLQKVKVPVTIFHGTRDELIPYSHAKKLAIESGAKLITIPKGKHNNLPNFNIYQSTLQNLLSGSN